MKESNDMTWSDWVAIIILILIISSAGYATHWALNRDKIYTQEDYARIYTAGYDLSQREISIIAEEKECKEKGGIFGAIAKDSDSEIWFDYDGKHLYDVISITCTKPSETLFEFKIN